LSTGLKARAQAVSCVKTAIFTPGMTAGACSAFPLNDIVKPRQ